MAGDPDESRDVVYDGLVYERVVRT